MIQEKRKSAFTLIELLIVVSIIAILAVIAMPNYGDAQIRSKVAATKSNMRNVAVKMEMLNVDSNRYSLAGKWRHIVLYRRVRWLEHPDASTEENFYKAYKSLYGPFDDIFEKTALQARGGLDYDWMIVRGKSYFCHGFNFFHPKFMQEAITNGCDWEDMSPENWNKALEVAGAWLLYSSGPDLEVKTPYWMQANRYIEVAKENYKEKDLFIQYDPTNGTVSFGNIFRSQKNPGGIDTDPYFYE